MDGVTERRLAAIILGEVAKLQRQVEERGVSAYLHPQVRHRPNSRFLQATVTSVQQANRTAQMEAMWRRHRTEEGGGQRREDGMTADMGTREKSPQEARERGEGDKEGAPLNALEAGLDDTSMEGFLHKRQKRGRGAVGARMDAAGPYAVPDLLIEHVREDWEDGTGGRAARPMLTALPPYMPRGSVEARRHEEEQHDEGSAAPKVHKRASRSRDKERKRTRKDEKSGGKERRKSSKRSTSPTKKKKQKERRKSNVD